MSGRKSFEGKVVLVTGGSKGIGRETARIFGQLGARLYICGRDTTDLALVKESFERDGIVVAIVQTDVRGPEACAHLIDTIKAEAGRLDVVVNNAGMSMRGSVEETAVEVVRAMMEINFLGAAYITHFAIPLLKATQGSVVFVSSLSALHGLPAIAPYGASKSALRALSESLRAELYRDQVHVGLVHVGFTQNDPGKVGYGKDGSLIPIQRPRNSSTQLQVAKKIVYCVLRRKRELVLTPLGKLAGFVYRFFPRLADFIISRSAGKSNMYGVR
jgi:NAD(P)-dependent dehydrogenase (short-subunit alcohol dehydrogenase family)